MTKIYNKAPKRANSAPRCKLCGKSHWFNEPHGGGTPVVSGARRPLTPVGETEAPVSDEEAAELARLEALIEPRLRDWIIVGEALATIRDRRLYRRDFRTFEAYCEQRWSMTRMRAHQLITGQQFVNQVYKTNLPAPRSERVARELAPLAGDPERQIEAWQEVVEEHGPAPTVAQAREVVRREHGERQAAPVGEGEPSARGGTREDSVTPPAAPPDGLESLLTPSEASPYQPSRWYATSRNIGTIVRFGGEKAKEADVWLDLDQVVTLLNARIGSG